MDQKAKEATLQELHAVGVALAMLIDGDRRWVGIRANDDGRKWCLVGGSIRNLNVFERYCWCSSYDDALDAFKEWWDAGFPPEAPCTNGVRPVHARRGRVTRRPAYTMLQPH